MTSFFLPDVNVWVALNYGRHVHHAPASLWYRRLPDDARLVFCRQTQLGLFRLLSTQAVMGHDVLAQKACWRLFDRWIGTHQITWADDPNHLEPRLRARTESEMVAPKAWMDDYLAAFADVAGLTLVTFDRALAGKAKGALLLA